jgi:hypothetical protein
MNLNLKFSVTVIGQETQKQELVSLDLLYTLVYLFDVATCCRSKDQRNVTFSSTEDEYIAISGAVKEIKLIGYLLNDLHAGVILPILVKTDNVGVFSFPKILQLAFEQGMWKNVITFKMEHHKDFGNISAENKGLMLNDRK